MPATKILAGMARSYTGEIIVVFKIISDKSFLLCLTYSFSWATPAQARPR
jgi:hypothetical protein